MPDPTHTVQALVNEIKRRWRRRALMQGGAYTLLALAGAAGLVLLVHGVLGVPVQYLAISGAVAGLCVLSVFAWYVIRPAIRSVSDRRVALFVEERVPELEDRLNSAIEVGQLSAAEHDALLDQITQDAVRRTSSISMGSLIEPRRARLLLYGASAALLIGTFVSYMWLDTLSFDAQRVRHTGPAPSQRPFLTVKPGNAEVEKGTSQPVTVELREATGDSVKLHYRTPGADAWRTIQMQRDEDERTYLHAFASIQDPIQYYVELDTTTSPTFAISLYEFPSVREADLTYTYPSYTQRPPRTETDTYEIEGLQRSTVTVDLRASATARTAELVLNGGDSRIPLDSVGTGVFRGRFTLRESGTYRIVLTDQEGKHNKFQEEHLITVVEDRPPQVTVTLPQRDVRANAVEEVQIAADAQDDFGIKSMHLKYSVNGNDEEAISLMDSTQNTSGTTPNAVPPPESISGMHRFFLETIDGLKPGDIISYYVEAQDYAPDTTPQATDMYFVEVVPYQQLFTQVNNQGGGGMGGQQSGIVLNQQQIITATWKLRRQQPTMPEAEFEKSLESLQQAQANLKRDVEKRISNTAFSVQLRTEKKSQEVVRLLREATAHMDDALDELDGGRLDDALTPERKALNQLLRAEALNQERQVALNRPSQGGGGGSSATEERMTELMDLELDVSEDKYEMQQQQASAQPQGGGGSEALRRAQELARKQEKLLERDQQATRGEDKKREIERLRRQQEELQREAQALSQSLRRSSRQRSNPSSSSSSSDPSSNRSDARQRQQTERRAQQRLDRASEQMQRSEEALQRGDEAQAQRHQQEALRELNRMEQDLRMADEDGVRQTIDDMERGFEALKSEQERLARGMREAEEGANQANREATASDLAARQERQQRRLQQLEDQAAALRRSASQGDAQDDPQGGQATADAARDIERRLRQENVRENMENVRRALEAGQINEAREQNDDVQEGLERLAPTMDRLTNRSPGPPDDQVARSLEQVEDLKRQLDAMQGQDTEQAQQQAREIREAIRAMQQRLDGNEGAQRALNALSGAVGRADYTGERLEGDAARDYFDQEVYRALSNLEAELAQQLGTEPQGDIYTPRSGDAPPTYRDLIEKYYESLSRGDSE